MTQETFSLFENGRLNAHGRSIRLAGVPWAAHPEFEGVFLKPVLEAEATGGLLRAFLVRVEPGYRLGLHAHPHEHELHEVMGGSGICLVKGSDIAYAPGSVALIPRDAAHEVAAGREGLFLFAKFLRAERART